VELPQEIQLQPLALEQHLLPPPPLELAPLEQQVFSSSPHHCIMQRHCVCSHVAAHASITAEDLQQASDIYPLSGTDLPDYATALLHMRLSSSSSNESRQTYTCVGKTAQDARGNPGACLHAAVLFRTSCVAADRLRGFHNRAAIALQVLNRYVFCTPAQGYTGIQRATL